MSYTTQAQILMNIPAATLAGLVDDLNTPPNLASVNAQQVLNGLILGADAWINDFLGLITTVPLVGAVPPTIELAARNYVLYHAYARRGVVGSQNPYYEEYYKGEDYLMRVADGRSKIVLSTGVEVRTGTIRSSSDGVDRVFSLSELEDY